MKSPERFLREWASNRIRFHAGVPQYQLWTRKGIEVVAFALRTGLDGTNVELVRPKEVPDDGTGTWEVHYTGVINRDMMWQIQEFLKEMGERHIATARWVAQFDSLRELWRDVCHRAVVKGFTIKRKKNTYRNGVAWSPMLRHELE